MPPVTLTPLQSAVLMGPQGPVTALASPLVAQLPANQQLAELREMAEALLPHLASRHVSVGPLAASLQDTAAGPQPPPHVQVGMLAGQLAAIPPAMYLAACDAACLEQAYAMEPLTIGGEAYLQMEEIGRFAMTRAEAVAQAWTRTAFDARYELQHQLGAGGEVSAYLAYDRQDQKLVVVRRSKDPHAIGVLYSEARALQQLRHPNLVRLREAMLLQDGAFGEEFITVTDYVPGDTLADILRATKNHDISRQHDFTEAEILEVLSQVALGLSAAHAAGVIHRDLKPSNVVLERRDDGTLHATVIDFGIAKHVGDRTRTSSLGKGTIDYMAPEQLMGGKITSATDSHGMGLLAIAMAEGREREDDIRHEPPAAAVARLRASGRWSPAFCDLVAKAVAKNPADRPMRKDTAQPPSDVATVSAMPSDTTIARSVPASTPAPTDLLDLDPEIEGLLHILLEPSSFSEKVFSGSFVCASVLEIFSAPFSGGILGLIVGLLSAGCGYLGWKGFFSKHARSAEMTDEQLANAVVSRLRAEAALGAGFALHAAVMFGANSIFAVVLAALNTGVAVYYAGLLPTRYKTWRQLRALLEKRKSHRIREEAQKDGAELFLGELQREFGTVGAAQLLAIGHTPTGETVEIGVVRSAAATVEHSHPSPEVAH